MRAAASTTNDGAQRTDAPYLYDLPACDALTTLHCMDLPVRKKLPHTIPQWVAEGSWFFITIKVRAAWKKPVVPR